jgi:hypothetical protein
MMHYCYSTLQFHEIKLQYERKTALHRSCCIYDTAQIKSGVSRFPTLYSALNAAQFPAIHMGGSLSGTLSLPYGPLEVAGHLPNSRARDWNRENIFEEGTVACQRRSGDPERVADRDRCVRAGRTAGR